MTIKELKASGWIVLECISGSKAYGLDLPSSDTDIKGVFVLPQERLYGFDYLPQIANESNDLVYYELGRYLELLSKNNPNILELLATPADKILYQHPLMKALKPELFLSKRCKNSFGGYAFTQVRKARGLNKKIVNPVAKEKKTILDFCYVLNDKGSVSLDNWLESKQLDQLEIGLVKIAHFRGVYAMYHDTTGLNKYKGIMRKAKATNLLLSSVPKGELPIGHLSFNEDGYIKYCKDYKDYWDWVDKRNEKRYLNNVEHGKNYDSKNMMHTFRLLDMAIEILQTGKIQVKRPNREELLAIRRGEWSYEELIVKAEKKMQKVETAYEKSILPVEPDRKAIEDVLIKLRKAFYSQGKGL